MAHSVDAETVIAGKPCPFGEPAHLRKKVRRLKDVFPTTQDILWRLFLIAAFFEPDDNDRSCFTFFPVIQ